VPSGVAPLPVLRVCQGDAVVLDAGSLGLSGCASTTSYEWHQGATLVGTGQVVTVSPAASTRYVVTVTCVGMPGCAAQATVDVEVDAPPAMSPPTWEDLHPCLPGVRLSWPRATFTTPLGAVYNVYRSATSCADALTRPPVAPGVTALSWLDSNLPGGRAFYVVQAEDGVRTTPCPQVGPHHGGAIAEECVGPVVDQVVGMPPDGVYATLRASHAEGAQRDDVTMAWGAARALLPGEHFHLLKAWGTPTSAWVRVNAEADLSRARAETDTTARLQFFDLRVANPCEDQSLDEFPPGYDN
jgi:hypothetical protein